MFNRLKRNEIQAVEYATLRPLCPEFSHVGNMVAGFISILLTQAAKQAMRPYAILLADIRFSRWKSGRLTKSTSEIGVQSIFFRFLTFGVRPQCCFSMNIYAAGKWIFSFPSCIS
jgi:hypothetical protein